MFKLLLFLFASCAFAQTTNSVTVTASRSQSPQPDQVMFYVTIQSGTDSALEDVVAVGAGVGLKAANLYGVSYYSQYSYSVLPVSWTFSLASKLSDYKATVGLLSAMQKSLAKDGKFALSFSIAGTQISDQASNCSMADLISDARAQAAKLASAAGMSVGAIQAIGGMTTGVAASSNGIAGSAAQSSPVCSITVKFALGGF